MIAVDTSSFIAYLSGASGTDVEAVDKGLAESQVCLPPVVLTELLSDPRIPKTVVEIIEQIPLLRIHDGYWRRAGQLRARILAKRRKARLADSLIAQSCLDHDLPLIARDKDYRHFAAVSRLLLIS